MKSAPLAAILIATVVRTSGQPVQAPYMVIDRETAESPVSSGPQLLVMADGRMICAADDRPNGRELWVTDGTPAGTHLLLDINPGPGSSYPSEFTELDGAVYFLARDTGKPGTGDVEPYQLWRTDGTTTGTWLVRQFKTPRGISMTPIVSGLVAGQGALFFFADDGEHGPEPWRSDGTASGTTLLKDVVPGPAGSSPGWPHRPFLFGDGILFPILIPGESYTAELWTSDGTGAGTQRVHSFAGTDAIPWGFIDLGDRTLFSAVDAEHGQELWRTDGTEGGTSVVKDLAPGAAHASPIPIGTISGAALFFCGNEPYGLWRSDGSDAGTVVLRQDVRAGAALDRLSSASIAGKLLFSADDQAHGVELWASDGTVNGTGLVRDIARGTAYGSPIGSGPSGLITAGARVFFSASDSTLGRELWSTDGTAARTVRVRDIRSGYESSNPAPLTRRGNLLYFTASDGVQNELWVSDGSEHGTVLAVNIASDAGSASLGEAVGVGNSLHFTGLGLWRSDGTEAGTAQISSVDAQQLTRVGSRIYFQGYDAVNSYELWTSNGTTAGTYVLRDIAPGAAQANPNCLTPAGLRLFFRASDASGHGLWFSDSVTSELAKVALPNDVGQVLNLAAVGRTVYFTDYYSGALWRTDGTNTGTKRMTPSQLATSEKTGNLHALDNALVFTAHDGTHGFELWRCDGTSLGTVMISDICPGGCSSVTPAYYGDSPNGTFATTRSALFFNATDEVHGHELWRSDGTAGGTRLVVDLAPGASDSDIVLLGSLGELAIFSHDDGEHGIEPWVSDGTGGGTRMLADLNPGPRSSSPGEFLTAGAAVYFAASDDLHGRELWSSDGTASGTALIGDINPGPSSSSPAVLRSTDGLVFFVADDGIHGTELWALPYGAVHRLRQRVSR